MRATMARATRREPARAGPWRASREVGLALGLELVEGLGQPRVDGRHALAFERPQRSRPASETASPRRPRAPV